MIITGETQMQNEYNYIEKVTFMLCYIHDCATLNTLSYQE